MVTKFNWPLLRQLTADFAEFKIRRELFRINDIKDFFRPERATTAVVPNRLVYIPSVFHLGGHISNGPVHSEFLRADSYTSKRSKKASSVGDLDLSVENSAATAFSGYESLVRFSQRSSALNRAGKHA
jgi:hypothetical protein